MYSMCTCTMSVNYIDELEVSHYLIQTNLRAADEVRFSLN